MECQIIPLVKYRPKKYNIIIKVNNIILILERADKKLNVSRVCSDGYK